jgi:hypothetical protein
MPWRSMPRRLPTQQRTTLRHTLARSAPAEQAVERAPDLLGEGSVGPGDSGSSAALSITPAGWDEGGRGLTDQAAVQALDLAQPTDQVHAPAAGTGLKVGGPVTGFLTSRADKYQLVAQHPAAPGALAPLRVRLPHTATVTGQFGTPPQKPQGTP